MSIIQVTDLTVKYDQVVALEDVNFTIDPLEFIGIIGPNGGGKTTLVKTLLGLVKPSSGVANINSDQIVGYVPQNTKFDKEFPITVMDVILTGHLPKRIQLWHRFKGHDERHGMEVMKRLGIEHLANRQIGMLSGGQLQRVLIARALMNHPTILILDEPTANVDEATKKEIYDMLKELNKTMTILIITHETSQMWPYLDRCIYIHRKAHIHNHQGEVEDPADPLEVCPIEWYVEGEKLQQEWIGKREKEDV